MNKDEPYEQWLLSKQSTAPPEEFVTHVMSTIDKHVGTRSTPVALQKEVNSISRRCFTYFVWSAVAVVCMVRVTSLMIFMIVPTPEYSVVTNEPIEEFSDEQRDGSRS